jgi:multidrug efflux pump
LNPIIDEVARAKPVSQMLAVVYPDSMSVNEIRNIINSIHKKLNKIPQLGLFKVNAEPKKTVYLSLNPEKLTLYGLQESDIIKALKNYNIQASVGTLKGHIDDILMSIDAKTNTLKDINAIKVKLLHSSETVELKDLLNVSMQKSDAKDIGIAIYNQKPAVLLKLYTKENAGQVALNHQVEHVIKHLNKTLPKGMSVHTIFSKGKEIQSINSHFKLGLVLSLIILCLALFLLMGFSTGLFFVVILPSILCLGCILMFFNGMAIERFSFAGLIIVLGMLVDSAVIFVEKAKKLMNDGLEVVQAVKEANKAVNKPLLISQITTIFAFLPPLLTRTKITEYISALPITAIIFLISATIFRIMILPTLCCVFFKNQKVSNNWRDGVWNKISLNISKFSSFCISHKIIFALLFIGLIPASAYTYKQVKYQFYSEAKTQYLVVEARGLNDLSIKRIHQLMPEISNKLSATIGGKKIDSITSYFSIPAFHIGNQVLGTNYGAINFIVKMHKPFDYHQRKKLDHDITDAMNDFNPDISVFITPFSSLGSYGGSHGLGIEFRDINRTGEVSSAFYNTIAGLKGTTNIDTSSNNRLFLKMHINYKRLHQVGLQAVDVVNKIRHYANDNAAIYLYHHSLEVPIVIRAARDIGSDLSRFKKMSIYSNFLEHGIPLNYLIDFKISLQPTSYTMFMSHNIVDAFFSNPSLSYDEAFQYVKNKIKILLPNIKYKVYIFSGKHSKEANKALFGKFIFCFIIILLLLFYVLRSLRGLLILFLSIPLAVFGGFLSLFITGEPFGFLPSLGLIALFGIIVNDGLLLLTHVEKLRQQGLLIKEALIEAVTQKVRPILLTSITTVLGMLPLYFSVGDFWRGILVMIMGGVFFGTIMLLIAIPVFYAVLFKDKKVVAKV